MACGLKKTTYKALLLTEFYAKALSGASIPGIGEGQMAQALLPSQRGPVAPLRSLVLAKEEHGKS